MSETTSMNQLVARYPSVPYWAPFAIFMVFTALQGSLPGAVVWAYPAKTLLTAAALVYFARWWPPLGRAFLPGSVAVGGLVFLIWVGIDPFYPHMGGEAEVFVPSRRFEGVGLYAWIGIRLVGSVVVVAFMEEIFWRGFLIRWLVKPDFQKVAIGTFTWMSFLVTSGLFALEHNRWLAGLLAGAIYNLWLYRTKSLLACVIAHGVTNLILGIWILYTGNWAFW